MLRLDLIYDLFPNSFKNICKSFTSHSRIIHVSFTYIIRSAAGNNTHFSSYKEVAGKYARRLGGYSSFANKKLNAKTQSMRVFGSLERNAKAFAEFAEWLRRLLRALQVASATLCALQLLSCNSLKLCGSAFRNERRKLRQ